MSNVVNLDRVKTYLRIDEDSENDLLVELIEFSKEDVSLSTRADYETYKEDPLYKMLQMIIIADGYENRSSIDYVFRANNRYSALCEKLRTMVEDYD